MFGRGRSAVTDATEQVQQWAGRWQHYLPDMPATTSDVVARAARLENTPDVHDALHRHARQVAEQAHPDHALARAAADTETRRRDQRGGSGATPRPGWTCSCPASAGSPTTPAPHGYSPTPNTTSPPARQRTTPRSAGWPRCLANPRCAPSRASGSASNANSGPPPATTPPSNAGRVRRNAPPAAPRACLTIPTTTTWPRRSTAGASAGSTGSRLSSGLSSDGARN